MVVHKANILGFIVYSVKLFFVSYNFDNPSKSLPFFTLSSGVLWYMIYLFCPEVSVVMLLSGNNNNKNISKDMEKR